MSYNILIADDSLSMRRVLMKAINMCHIGDVTFIEAKNGLDALEKLQNEWVDVIFTDINMPQMDGITFLKTLKNKPDAIQTPIIVVTSEARFEEQNNIEELGVCGVISKPFQPEEIKQLLSSILNVKGDKNEDEDDNFEGYDF